MAKETNPNDAPDYSYWAKLDGWGIEEAILLLKGIDPNQAEVDDSYYQQRNTESPRNGKLRELITRAVKSGGLKTPFSPADFISWASAKEIEIPDELKLSIAKATGQIPYEVLVIENQNLKAQLEKLTQPSDLAENERDSLYRIIVGLTEMIGKFNPRSQRDPFAGIVEKKLDKLTIPLSQAVINKKIRTAYEATSPLLGEKIIG